MSSPLADRLRGIVRPPASGPAPPVRADADAVAATLGGEWVDSRDQRYVVVDRAYGPGYRHGRVAMMDGLPPWPRLALLGGGMDQKLLFIDLETTGLAGGAGTYAFLVGCGWFDGAVFRVRQFFLATHAAEPALLDGVAQLVSGISGVVSFNGKSFDLPLIETRYLFHRRATPFAGLPHVDMVHPARRLWRDDVDEGGGTAGCRLAALEAALCGVAREGDVPGFEIPARYFHYVRSGDARPLAAVLEHNRLDLLSLALVTARAARMLEEGPAAARTAREALGMGTLYERGAMCDHARAAYARAADDLLADACLRAEALRRRAVLARRQRRFAEAAESWRRILEIRRCPPHLAREAAEALAVHHEHRLRDPGAARRFALQTLGFDPTAARRQAVHHRLTRLERKLGGPATMELNF